MLNNSVVDTSDQITPKNTAYPFGDVDKWLYEHIDCPAYWVIREAYGAFSSENFSSDSKDSLILLNELGLHNHLAMTSLAGAKYHFHLLRTYTSASFSIVVRVWEEVASVVQSLYKGWNGILSSSFAILYPWNLMKIGLAANDRGYIGVNLKKKLTDEEKYTVKTWLRERHPDILKKLKQLKHYHGYRNLDTHRRRNFVEIYSGKNTNSINRIRLLKDPYSRPRSIKPSYTDEWVEGYELLEEAIQGHESTFNDIWEYIANLQLHEDFFDRYDLILKDKVN